MRKSIKSLAKSESRLLDSIASAEMQKEIQNKVIKVIKAQSTEIEQQTGSKPSMTDDEIKEYLDKALKEIRR
jgi:fructose-1-phosphate kinase PfkB-like protein